jgi:hypothetical protein
LKSLGGRAVSVFDFIGTGAARASDASPSAYQVTTGAASLTNATVGEPVAVSGLVTAFGTAPPDFSASTLLDSTTIDAMLVLDWGAGTSAPFASYSTTQINVDARNASIGARHAIEVGSQTINILGMAQGYPLIVPSSTDTLFTIGHAASGTSESFDSFSAFITQLQTELNGTVLATGITALGQYSTATYTLSASSMSVFLNN